MLSGGQDGICVWLSIFCSVKSLYPLWNSVKDTNLCLNHISAID